MPYLGILGYKFEKLSSYLKSATSNLSMQSFVQNQNSLTLRLKMLDLGVFGLQFI